MKNFARFQRGSALFNCRSCGRATRETGGDHGSIELCAECFDWSSAENTLNDGGYETDEERAYLVGFIAQKRREAVAKGGRLDLGDQAPGAEPANEPAMLDIPATPPIIKPVPRIKRAEQSRPMPIKKDPVIRQMKLTKSQVLKQRAKEEATREKEELIRETVRLQREEQRKAEQAARDARFAAGMTEKGGRPRVFASGPMEIVSIRLTPEHKAKLKRLGRDWLARTIENAPEPGTLDD
jgi:hypothetical protein